MVKSDEEEDLSDKLAFDEFFGYNLFAYWHFSGDWCVFTKERLGELISLRNICSPDRKICVWI